MFVIGHFRTVNSGGQLTRVLPGSENDMLVQKRGPSFATSACFYAESFRGALNDVSKPFVVFQPERNSYVNWVALLW